MAPVGEKLNRFKVPVNIDLDNLRGKHERVCVVGVVGKSGYKSRYNKARLINTFTDTDIFVDEDRESKDQDGGEKDAISIEGYYDEDSKVIYLHLVSAFDIKTLNSVCLKSLEEPSATFHSVWQEEEYRHARAVLYLFSISHIILLVHPSSSFDITYVRFFRVLDSIRQKLQPSLSEVLREFELPKDWIAAGRPCSPRVLFLFQTCTLEQSAAESDTIVMSKSRSQKTPPIKRLQHAIEDQVYRVLRKSRVITNISNNSLFAVPANQEFVYVHTQEVDTSDPVTYYLDQLKQMCYTRKDTDSLLRVRRAENEDGFSSEEISSLLTTSTQVRNDNSFRDFLWQHIELALSKGFDDNVGRNPVPSTFEVPILRTWMAVCNRLFEFFLVDQKDTKSRPHFNTLKSLLEVDGRFSEGRCSKVLPLAEAAYQEGLPPHYTKSYHINKLAQAKRVFCQHARGPACEKYLQQLSEDCEKIWRNGRQLCEETSLTGSHCVNEFHRLPDSEETEENQRLPIMPHSSQIKTKATCNCGRKQAEREDPFDHKTANYEFYQKLEQICCSKLEKHDLPVFIPSSAEFKASTHLLTQIPEAMITDDKAKSQKSEVKTGQDSAESYPKIGSRRDSSRLDLVQGMSSLSLALSLGLSGASDVYTSHSGGQSLNPDQVMTPADQSNIHSQSRLSDNKTDTQTDKAEDRPTDRGEMSEENESDDKVTRRQPSTTEYLPGMMHTCNATAGLLPKFSSWSLLCLGKYSSYSPTQGLDQPGFLHSSNFLLPWDISVRGDKEKWPSVMETSAKKSKSKKITKECAELSFRLYLGNEYECPRGHRFFCSSPDKLLKAPTSGLIKDTAVKLLSCDMPLYFPCHCRSSKGYMAQLMRVFVAIPDGPVEVSLNPRVLPGLPPCPEFYPGNDAPILLRAGCVWVLRLPYIYVGDSGPYLMPADMQQLTACRIQKGLYVIHDHSQN